MTERLENLLGLGSSPETQDDEMDLVANEVEDDIFASQNDGVQLPVGWKLSTPTQWKAAPIGVFL